MNKTFMILPASNSSDIRLLRLPHDMEEHEAYRHVTGVIAAMEEEKPECSLEDIEAVLEDHGYQPMDFILGPSMD